jgi:hypothetical protein
MTDASNESGTDSRPPLEITQNNVGLANTYRIELSKQLLTIATALFAFTVTFYGVGAPGARAPGAPYAAYTAIGWAALAASIFCGLFVMWAWERFYISYRDCDYHGEGAEGFKRRKRLTAWRRAALVVQYATFLGGVVCVGLFAYFRLSGS